MGVFPIVPGNIGHRLHPALLTAGTKCDVDADDFEHHFPKGVSDLEPLGGYLE